VAAGEAEQGVVPIENSLAGSVLENYDLLLEYDAQIVGEVSLPVRHCLLAPPGRALADITHCYSHPQALAQCARFLTEHDIEPRAARNTAEAARDLASRDEPGAAAIASARAGQLHGLDTVVGEIQTRADNTTRFFVIARERPTSLAAEKTSLAFSTVNRPGALLHCLEAFAGHSLNLTKLESRPTGDALWEYHFYVDAEAQDGGALPDGVLATLVADLAPCTSFVRVLGQYPQAR
ncbi:MAG: bifunctional chorismate mutase/prephenate dehydratase, partial [Thermoleophilia bacterium]|nr:bifunctional chorismate mutase/prephenate dehydratase [Thermoleophilia bacterium]